MQVLTDDEINAVAEEVKIDSINEHNFAERCAQKIMKLALRKKCAENATIIVIILRKLPWKVPS
jgi:serine/threonine protein phosphatase PrpC